MLKREIDAVASVLTDPTNRERTAEEVAQAAISAVDAVRAQHNRLAVVARYTWDQETYHLTVVGPFSTRAPGAARRAGEGMAGDLAHPGQGKWVLAPIYPTPREAWAAISPEDTAERREAARVFRAMTGDFNPWGSHGPVCHCGVAQATRPCPVHARST